jgi:hypothetical protein
MNTGIMQYWRITYHELLISKSVRNVILNVEEWSLRIAQTPSQKAEGFLAACLTPLF